MIMLLKELMELANINISLSENAQEIEIDDDFSENYFISITDEEISVTCPTRYVDKTINFNFDKNTITELITSDLGNSGTVYSIKGEIIKVIN